MKNVFRMVGIIALVAIIGFGVIACDNGDLNNNNNNNTDNNTENNDTDNSLQTQNLTIAGTFNGQGTAKFSANSVGDQRSAYRAITETSFELEGLLEDDDITFRLKGNYNSDTNTYTLSAASSILRYTISGGFDSTGIATGGKAVLQVNAGGTWTTIEVPVEASATALPITTHGTIQDQTEEGIPASMRGIWRDDTDASLYIMVNAFSVILYELKGGEWVEMKNENGDSAAMYFSDVTTAGGIISGTTAYKNWDWIELFGSPDGGGEPGIFDHLNYTPERDFYNGTPKGGVSGFTSAEKAGYVGGNAVEAKFSKTTTGAAIINKSKFNDLLRYYDIAFGVDPSLVSSTYEEQMEMWQAQSEYMFEDFRSWLLAQNPSWAQDYMMGNETLEQLQTRSEYRTALETFRNGDGKTKGDQLKAEVGLFVKVKESDYDNEARWDLYNEFHNEYHNAKETWAASQNILTSEYLWNKMWDSGYAHQWLKSYVVGAGYAYDDLYIQFYSKMALRLSGGKLEWGQYHNSDYDYEVKNFSQVSTLNTLEWMGFSLTR